MKKTIIILSLILAVTYIGLSVLGRGGEYAAEKLLYRAMKVTGKIAANPDIAPPKLVEYVETTLKTLLKKYPQTKAARAANMSLAELYVFNKNYDKGLSQTESIIKEYCAEPAMVSMALFLRGQIYEKENKWPIALKEYEKLRDKYTNTQLGMHMPIYIAKYYENKGMDADAKQAYNDAVAFYKKLEKENSKKVLGYLASLALLQTYLDKPDYEQAGRILEETLNKYMSRTALLQLLPQVENIFVTKLNQPEKAIEIYNGVIEKVKDEKLKQVLQKRIDALKTKK